MQVLHWLTGLGAKDTISLSEIDAVLLRWLHACYLQASSLPGVFRCGRSSSAPPPVPLCSIVAATGLLGPFIGGINRANGRLMVSGNQWGGEGQCRRGVCATMSRPLGCWRDSLETWALQTEALPVSRDERA